MRSTPSRCLALRGQSGGDGIYRLCGGTRGSLVSHVTELRDLYAMVRFPMSRQSRGFALNGFAQLWGRADLCAEDTFFSHTK